MSIKSPNVYIIAGANGAGKTTFAKEFLPGYAKCRHFINADLIAQGIAPFAPETAAMKAGRIVLEQLQSLVEERADFAFESTLAGTTYLSFLKTLKSKGYKIHIFYLWIPSVDLALSRIKERVAQGGHHVPSRDVRRRFKKSPENFLKKYMILADYWQIFDNSSIAPRLIAEGNSATIHDIEKELPALLKMSKKP